MNHSTPSPDTLQPNAPFGKLELDYLTRIEAAMENLVQVSTVKMWLTEAAEKGLDPNRLYGMAVKARPREWTPAPPFSDVMPTASR